MDIRSEREISLSENILINRLEREKSKTAISARMNDLEHEKAELECELLRTLIKRVSEKIESDRKEVRRNIIISTGIAEFIAKTDDVIERLDKITESNRQKT